jgi:hypothetical protein
MLVPANKSEGRFGFFFIRFSAAAAIEFGGALFRTKCDRIAPGIRRSRDR